MAGFLAKIGAALTGLPAPVTPTAAHAALHEPEQKSGAYFLSPALFDLSGNPLRTADAPLLAGIATVALVPLCYIALNFRATKLTEAPLWIYDETDDGENALQRGHPLESLLERPNPDMTASEFWTLVSYYLDAPGGGSCLLVKNRDRGGRVGSLYPYSRGEFTVEAAEGRLYGRFTVHTTDGPRRYGAEDVIYLREVDPRSPWGALSPGDAALADLNLGESQRRAVQAAFRNTVAPGGLLETEQAIGDDAFLRLKQEIAASYGGVQNAGKVMLLDHGLTYKQLQHSLKDIGLGPILEHVEATVCAAFQVHPLLLGLNVSAKMGGGLADSLEPAQRLFYDLCLFPRWARIAEKLTDGLLREIKPGNMRRFLRFDTSRVRALQEDVGAKVITAAAATFWTTNEKRAFTGMQPVDDPAADVLQVGPIAPAEPDDDEETPNDEAEKAAAAPAEAKAISDRDVAWLIFDAAAQAHESSLRLATSALLQEDRDALVRLVTDRQKAGAAPATKETVRPLTPEEIAAIEAAASAYLAGEAADRWGRRMRPALELVGRSAVERVASAVGISFDVLQEGLLDVVEQRAGLLITSVTETTRDAVRRALRDGLEAGESIPDLARRIADAASFSQERATLIARTESTAMANLTQRSQLEAYAKRTGRKVTKTWLATQDSRTRDAHRALDGQTRAIDKAFGNGLMEPGEPNCRCSLTYSVAEAA